MASETQNQECLKEAIIVCEDSRDFVSREILEQILEDTEEHIDWIESQETIIEQAGLPNYLQEHIHGEVSS